MENNGLSGLKSSMITQVEKVVDDLRKRIELNRRELEQLEANHQEARDMLLLLKSGHVPTANKRVKATDEEYIEACHALNDEYGFVDAPGLIEMLGVSQGGASQKLLDLMHRGIITRIERGKYTITKE